MSAEITVFDNRLQEKKLTKNQNKTPPPPPPPPHTQNKTQQTKTSNNNSLCVSIMASSVTFVLQRQCHIHVLSL